MNPIHTTALVTMDDSVSAPVGIVYSTNPTKAEAEDGFTYFVKGPAPEVMFAEIAGCSLAREVGLPAPLPAVCSAGPEKFGATREVPNVIRDVSAWIDCPQKITNAGDLYGIIVLDAWLANFDRNLYNVVGTPDSGSNINVVFIDFEKSVALRRNPIVQATMVQSARLWPSGELGAVLKSGKPLQPPQEVMARIEAFSTEECTAILSGIAATLGGVDWHGNSVQALMHRAARIRQIAGEVWQSN